MIRRSEFQLVEGGLYSITQEHSGMFTQIVVYSTEFCHLIRRKVATQSTPKLPCSPHESCHPIHVKVAIHSGAKLPPPSECSDAMCSMGNLISPGLSIPLHVVPPDVE